MANYWAIAIGINQYQFLQPLMYAQWDAYCLNQCFQKEAGFRDEHCWLLTDTSTPIQHHDSRPTRENIQHHIVQLCQHQLAEDDVLWVFFSGYGVHEKGRDYLIPSDGDPAQPIATGIPVSELFATLKTAATSNIVVLLDMKQFGGNDARLGHHTLSLAQEYNLAVVLACQPGQFSHETLALRQGLFAAVVLEGIQQHGCVTLEHLVQYTSDRLPTLSEQHWRPRQEPATYIPSELRYQLMLPGKEVAVAVSTTGTGLRMPTQIETDSNPHFQNGAHNTSDRSQSSLDRSPSTHSAPFEPPVSSKVPYTPISNGSPEATVPQEEGIQANDNDAFWNALLKWGGLVLAFLLIGVVWRNWSVFRGNSAPDGSDTTGEEVRRNAPAPLSPNTARADLNVLPNTASASVSETNTPPEENTPLVGFPMDEAQQAIAAGRPLEGLEWLNQIPESEQTERYATLRAEAEQLNTQLTRTNQAILNEAIASLNRDREETPVNQASDFHRALTQASRIQAGQPMYQEAQQYVERWSQVILDLAEARAQTGSYADAVGAAQLVPPNQAELRSMAEERIANWQQNVDQVSVVQDAIQQARSRVRPGQASSYNDAIAQLRSIEATQPEYEVVRVQLNEWSREILAIAYQRAESGNLYEAIEAGALVPDDAEVALEARAAVETWRLQLRGN